MSMSLDKLVVLLESLFEASRKQVEALQRMDLDEFASLMKTKDDLLASVGRELGRCSAQGIALMNPRTYPVEPKLREQLFHAAMQIRRFQAHEKSVASRVASLHEDIRRKLLSSRHKRTALSGYAQPRTGAHRLTMVG
jgi:hypothetical protein